MLLTPLAFISDYAVFTANIRHPALSPGEKPLSTALLPEDASLPVPYKQNKLGPLPETMNFLPNS
jgi:hypothetical protein